MKLVAEIKINIELTNEHLRPGNAELFETRLASGMQELADEVHYLLTKEDDGIIYNPDTGQAYQIDVDSQVQVSAIELVE